MEIIYFEVNDWSAGRDFPDCEPFNTWLSINNLTFRNEQWLIENKIIVVETIIDMSLNYCVTAPKEWVEKNCPCILNSKFIREPDKNNEVFGKFTKSPSSIYPVILLLPSKFSIFSHINFTISNGKLYLNSRTIYITLSYFIMNLNVMDYFQNNYYLYNE